MKPYPNFFLVGAPKCGTTAFYDFLRQHPEVFLPATKELLVFGSDLSYRKRLSEDQFAAHFADWRGERRIGTSHTAYLQSTNAASEIKAMQPTADIIVMLRNPVEVVYSWHSELLYQTIEDIEDFELALDTEQHRRQGNQIPRNARNSYVESLFYTDVATFSRQVARYFDAFGRSHVHVIIHDDLLGNPHRVYRDTLEFLGVEPTFAPNIRVQNANKVVRSSALQKIYFATAAPGHQALKRLLPRQLRRSLLAMNVEQKARTEMAPHVRQRLEVFFRPEIARLSDLLDRDLSTWLSGTELLKRT